MTIAKEKMMIEDQELRALFKTESDQRLSRLDAGLLLLGVNPRDPTILEEVFREAHSLRGAARMLGVTGIETLAHRLEDALGAAKRGITPLSSEAIDRLSQAIDAMRQLVNEAVTGESANVDVARVLARMSGQEPPSIGDYGLRIAESAVCHPPSIISTIDATRIESQGLDALMTLAGELRVATHRILHRFAQLEEVVVLREDWKQDIAQLNSVADELEKVLRRFA
jgi:two-component system chemotaxis sensor kinase CheA